MSGHTQHEEPNLRQRGTTAQWKVGSLVQIPSRISDKIPPFLRYLKEGKELRIDSGMWTSLQRLQKFSRTATYIKSATGRGSSHLVPRSGKSGNSLSTGPRRQQRATTHILYQQSITRSRADLPENRKVYLYSRSNISTTSPVLPGSHY